MLQPFPRRDIDQIGAGDAVLGNRDRAPRPLEVIEDDIKQLEQDIMRMLGEVTGSSEATA